MKVRKLSKLKNETSIPKITKKKKILIAALFCIALLAVVSYFFLSTTNSPESVIRDYYSALERGRAEEVAALYPDEYIAYLEKKLNRSGFDDVAKGLSYDLKEHLRSLKNECGENLKISYTVKAQKKLIGESFEYLESTLSAAFGFDKGLCDEARTLRLQVTYSGELDTLEKEVTVTVIRINRTWYILGD